jgi:hypothetical protein
MDLTASLTTLQGTISATTPSQITTYATALESYHAIQSHIGSQYPNGIADVGNVELKDRQGRWWKIRVRWTAEIGHYLEFEQMPRGSQNFCALANNDPDGDRIITPDEWEIFAMLVDDRSNHALRIGAQKCLGRLIHALKAPEKDVATRE